MRFEPIYQYRLWGGRRLANLLAAPLPADEPIGEAWILSDVVLLPAVVGACRCEPNGTVTVLEISLPKISQP
jgi:hypothetical protein